MAFCCEITRAGKSRCVPDLIPGIFQHPSQDSGSVLMIFDQQNVGAGLVAAVVIERVCLTFEQRCLHRFDFDGESRPFALAFAVHGNFSAMQIDDAFGNGEAETESAVAVGHAFAALLERLENARLQLGANSYAGIGEIDNDVMPGVVTSADAERAAR